jgi:hypothetical protein
MPTMAKKIQSNPCSLTTGLSAKLALKAAVDRSIDAARAIVRFRTVNSNFVAMPRCWAFVDLEQNKFAA